MLIPSRVNDLYSRVCRQNKRFCGRLSDLKSHENYLEAIPDSQWEQFCKKVLLNSKHHKTRAWTPLFDSLAEAKGAFLLEHIGCMRKDIKLVPEGNTKTPDWHSKLPNQKEIMVEVKRINQSDEENKLWSKVRFESTKGRVLRIQGSSNTLSVGFFKKLISTVERAQKQLRELGNSNARKICLIEMNFDSSPEIWLEYFRQCEIFLAGESFASIDIEVVICNRNIWFQPLSAAVRLYSPGSSDQC